MVCVSAPQLHSGVGKTHHLYKRSVFDRLRLGGAILLHTGSQIIDENRGRSAFKVIRTIAVIKPSKFYDSQGCNGLIALLSLCFNILKRYIKKLCETIKERIPIVQAEFQKDRSCLVQTLTLTIHIEAGFTTKLKTSVAFIDLIAS